jgi:hypothetical protein
MRQDLAIFDFELAPSECESMAALLEPAADCERRASPR